MTTSTFIDTNTFEIFDYFSLKARPEFNPPNNTPGWPSSPESPSVDGFLAVLPGEPIQRFYEVEQPEVELWEVAEWADPAYFQDTDDKWKRAWSVRNMTQQELDDLNESRQTGNEELREMEYQAYANPLYFKFTRGDTTLQAYHDKVAEIKAAYPAPAIITIPE